jgi:hypothetical protein
MFRPGAFAFEFLRAEWFGFAPRIKLRRPSLPPGLRRSSSLAFLARGALGFRPQFLVEQRKSTC